jgi:hypothetical protein
MFAARGLSATALTTAPFIITGYPLATLFEPGSPKKPTNTHTSKKPMSDTCNMTVSCFHKHMDRFISLGFRLNHYCPDVGTEVVDLTDEDAAYGHANDLPKDIPFIAEHGSGCSYGAHLLACDGSRYSDIPGSSDGYLVGWDEQTQQPSEASLQAIREYLAVAATAEAILTGQLV